MHKAITASSMAAMLLITSVTAAAAWDDRGYREDHRGPGPVLGFVGDVLLGAVKVATAPLALLADVGRDGRRYHHRDFDDEGAYVTSKEQARAYYGAGAEFYGPPPGYYHYYHDR